MPNTYPYWPLDPDRNEIRVLQLHALEDADDTTTDAKIKCSLHYVSLSDLRGGYEIWLSHRQDCDPKFRAAEWAEYLPKWADSCGADFPPERLEEILREEAKRFTWGEYWALSYVWGDSSKTKTIHVDDFAVGVTENLYLALCRLAREPRHVEDGEYIWIDALCINQSDIAERDREVKRMGSIYSLARGVEVWLGEPVGPAEFFIAQWMEAWEQLGDDGISKWLGAQPDVAQATAQSIMIMAQTPYWRRVWVIQELALASSLSLAYYGKAHLKLEHVYRMLKFASETGEWTKDGYANTSWGHINYSLHCHSALTRAGTLMYRALLPLAKAIEGAAIVSADKNDDNSLGLARSRVLHIVAMAEATDPRDKAYGILALLPESLCARITPNYALSKEATWAMFTQAIIEETRSLGILAAKKDGESALPSWALNLDVSGGQLLDSCRASGGLDASFEFSDDHLSLRCRGLEIDCVATVGVRGTVPEKQENREIIRIEFPRVLAASGPTSDEPIPAAQRLALLRALVGDPHYQLEEGAPTVLDVPLLDLGAVIERMNPNVYVDRATMAILPREPEGDTIGTNHVQDDHSHAKTFTPNEEAWLDFLAANWQAVDSFFVWRRANVGFRLWDRNVADLFPSKAKPLPADGDAYAALLSQAGVVSATRCLLTTSSGRVGLGPADVQRGDRIFVIAGCDWPLVMRPGKKAGTLRIVGACFVDGYMLGQTVEGVHRAGDMDWIRIV